MMFAIFLVSLSAKDGHKIQFWPSVLGQGKDLGKKMWFSGPTGQVPLAQPCLPSTFLPSVQM